MRANGSPIGSLPHPSLGRCIYDILLKSESASLLFQRLSSTYFQASCRVDNWAIELPRFSSIRLIIWKSSLNKCMANLKRIIFWQVRKHIFLNAYCQLCRIFFFLGSTMPDVPWFLSNIFLPFPIITFFSVLSIFTQNNKLLFGLSISFLPSGFQFSILFYTLISFLLSAASKSICKICLVICVFLKDNIITLSIVAVNCKNLHSWIGRTCKD